MSKIKGITEKPANPRVVSQLEACLEHAKNGEIIQFILVARMTGGDRLYSESGANNSQFEMLGMIQDAANKFGAKMIDRMADE